MYKIKAISLLILTGTLIMASMMATNIVFAAETTLQVVPSEIIDTTLTQGKTFTINVSISDVGGLGLYAYEFKLYYDNITLAATAWALPPGHFLTPLDVDGDGVTDPEDEMEIYKVPASGIYQNKGYVLVAISSQGDVKKPKVGSGVLATITFNVTGIGSCILDLRDSTFADPDIQDISHKVVDGYFSNKAAAPPAKLGVYPPTISDPTLLPQQIFTINVTVAEVENLYGYEFKLSYNTTVLDCTNVTIHAVQNETNFTPQKSIDDPGGLVRVNVSYHSPAKPITTVAAAALVTMTFNVTALGESLLDLHSTSLVDQSGQSISHSVSDGYFRNLAARDLAIVSASLSRTHAYEKFRGREYIINITVVVRNEGDSAETFDLSTKYDNTSIGTQAIKDLGPHLNTTVTFSWNTTGLPLYVNYTIKAQAQEVPGESRTDNNLYTAGTVMIKIFGDTNGDKKVDILDVAEGSKAFGSYITHKRWNPNVDLDNDGKITVIDMVLITINFGRTF